MATRLDKIIEPILKEKCDKAFEAGYKKGFEAGGKNMLLAYENEINSLKRMLGRKRFLLKENGEIIPLDQRWIPVTERLPENELDRVLVATDCESPVGNQKLDTDRFRNGRWVRYGDHVTHWMPLPEPPKEGEG